jgi:hypothetical protein
MVKIFRGFILVLIALALAPRLKAQSFTSQRQAVPDPLAWMASVKLGSISDLFLKDLVVVTDDFEFFDKQKSQFNYKNFNRMGYFKIHPSTGLEYIKVFNPVSFLDPWDGEDWLPHLLRLQEIDGVIYYQAADQKLSLYQEGSEKVTKIFELSKVKANQVLNSQFLYQKILDAFNFDGFVIDQKDKYLLVALFRGNFPANQALLIEENIQQMRVAPKNVKASGLLQLRNRTNELAIYEILLSRDQMLKVPRGTKVLVGRPQP